MKQGIFEITENTVLNSAGDIFRMRLTGDTSAVAAPGQFVNVQLDGLYLRRPISVCDKEGDALTLIYKTVGHGTAQMAGMRPGEKLDLLTGLGNGYDLSISARHIYVIGGGVGVPPLYYLAKELINKGKTVSIVLGFNTASEILDLPEPFAPSMAINSPCFMLKVTPSTARVTPTGFPSSSRLIYSYARFSAFTISINVLIVSNS